MKTTIFSITLCGCLYLGGCARNNTASSTPTTPSPTATSDTASTSTSTPSADRDRTSDTSGRSQTSSTSSSDRSKTATTSSADRMAGKSLTGCLNKDADASGYVLTDESGKKTMVSGSADLAKHVGHRVRLSGSGSTQVVVSYFSRMGAPPASLLRCAASMKAKISRVSSFGTGGLPV
jgi:hypothetical protein